jgi:hypothetical protein
MPKKYDDVGLRKWSVSQAVEICRFSDGDVIEVSTRIHAFLMKDAVLEDLGGPVKPEVIPPIQPEQPLYDEPGYTYWKSVNGPVILRTKDGEGPGTPAEYWSSNDMDWVDTIWATWEILHGRKDWDRQ